MVTPISQITVYSNASTLGSTLVQVGTFPVDNSSQRSATLRGEDSVKLCFKSGTRIDIPAFSFIEYEGQIFFTKELYRPLVKGGYYEYSVKFVSFDNMLSKPQAYRHVVVDNEEWNEPEMDLNGDLQAIVEVVLGSITSCSSRYEGVFAYLLSHVELGTVKQGTQSKTFNFSEQKVSQVLEAIANDYEIDYWFEQVGNIGSGISKMKLHFCKLERTDRDMLVVSDETATTDDPKHPTQSLGLKECSFANEWSGVVHRLTPYGSDRNIKRQQAIVNDMYVSFGKRLRLQYDHSCTINGTTYQHAYAIKNEDGETEPLYVDENNAITIPGVTTGEESVEKYEDIYPRGHFRVTHVTQRGTEKPIYTVYAIPTEERNGVYTDLTDAQIDAMQADETKRLFPIQIAEGQTLSLHFESGFLNGREFEVANKSAVMKWEGDAYKVDPANGHWVACFEIEPTGDNNESPQVPFGTLVPRGKFDEQVYEGDIFAIFNMDMPAYYVESAQNELAQAAYDKMVGILSTRPEVKCRGNETFFSTHDIFLGQRVQVTSELFGSTVFVSRVTSFSHSLSKPNDVDFRLCSSRVQGSISMMKAAISDQTSSIQGVQQTAKSISRRAFRDVAEMKDMLESVTAEMMVVGVEKNQFMFTMGIECLEATTSTLTRKFDGLRITAGEIQHSQDAYIKEAFNGKYIVDACTLRTDVLGGYIDKNADQTHRETPYYLYAHINTTTGKATMELHSGKKDDTSPESDHDYLLLGILSSEFPDGTESLRVFNRSNGFTSIAGGTITTEQIQDPTRQLIIDMSSNPPRIIARNGAKIIGNISFLTSDGRTQSVQSYIDARFSGENLLSQRLLLDWNKTYDGITTFGFADGKSYFAINEWLLYKNIGDQSNYADILGGKVAFENNTRYCLKVEWCLNAEHDYDGLYLGFKYTDGTYSGWIMCDSDTTSPTVDTLVSAEGKTVAGIRCSYGDVNNTRIYNISLTKGENVPDVWIEAIDDIEPCGENLYQRKDPITISRKGYTGLGVTLKKDTRYLVSAEDIIYRDSSVATPYITLYEEVQSGGSTTKKELGRLRHNDKTDPRECVVVGSGGVLYAKTNTFPSASLSGVMVQRGTRKTAYQNAYRYLAESFENAARSGQTDIEGGLLATSLLKLRNMNGIVTAGMSGLDDQGKKIENGVLVADPKSHGVGVWAGATYPQALEAASGQRRIPVLFTKDGIGSMVGVFSVKEDKIEVNGANGTIVIDDDEGMTIYDASNYIKSIITPRSISDAQSGVQGMIDNSVIKFPSTSRYGYKYQNITLNNTSRSEKHQIQTSVIKSDGRKRISLDVGVRFHGGGQPQQELSKFPSMLFKVTLENQDTGEVAYTSTHSGSAIIDHDDDYYFFFSQFYKFSIDQDLAKGTYAMFVEIGFNVPDGEYIGNAEYYQGLIGEYQCQLEIDNKEVDEILGRDYEWEVLVGETMRNTFGVKVGAYTILGNDGILSYYNANTYFKVINGAKGQQIIANGLSTGSSGLSDGALYKSSDVISAFTDLIGTLKEIVAGVRSVGNNENNARRWSEKLDTVLSKIEDSGLIAAK